MYDVVRKQLPSASVRKPEVHVWAHPSPFISCYTPCRLIPTRAWDEATHLVACDLGASHSAPPPGLVIDRVPGMSWGVLSAFLSYMYNVCITSLIPRLFPSFCYTTKKLGRNLGMRLCIIHKWRCYFLYIGWLFHVDQASWWFTWRWYVQPGLSSSSYTCALDSFDISPYL